MLRTIASIVAGIVAWAVIVTILNFGLRAALPGYHAAETTLLFTAAMKTGRLVEAAITSLAAGFIVGLIEPSRKWPPALVGIVVLAMFLPIHINLWNKFPVWYHLAFLVPLVPLVMTGGSLSQGRRHAPLPA